MNSNFCSPERFRQSNSRRFEKFKKRQIETRQIQEKTNSKKKKDSRKDEETKRFIRWRSRLPAHLPQVKQWLLPRLSSTRDRTEKGFTESRNLRYMCTHPSVGVVSVQTPMTDGRGNGILPRLLLLGNLRQLFLSHIVVCSFSETRFSNTTYAGVFFLQIKLRGNLTINKRKSKSCIFS